MIQIIRSNSTNVDFVYLVKQLDAYLKIVDGDDHNFYNQYNNIDVLKHTVIAYFNNIPIGCGAFKKLDANSVEIKRMYTSPESRNLGVASKILNELERWAKELKYKYCILETGKNQIEAVHFYKKNHYDRIPNFEPYQTIDNSLCFKKVLKNNPI